MQRPKRLLRTAVQVSSLEEFEQQLSANCREGREWSFKIKARGDAKCSEFDDGDEDAGDGHQRAHHPKEIDVYTLVERANLFAQ